MLLKKISFRTLAILVALSICITSLSFISFAGEKTVDENYNTSAVVTTDLLPEKETSQNKESNILEINISSEVSTKDEPIKLDLTSYNKLKPNISYLVICSAYNPATSSGAFTLTVE